MFRSTQDFKTAMVKILNAINQGKDADFIISMFKDGTECYDALKECMDCNYILDISITPIPINSYNISMNDARLTFDGLEFLEKNKDLLS